MLIPISILVYCVAGGIKACPCHAITYSARKLSTHAAHLRPVSDLLYELHALPEDQQQPLLVSVHQHACVSCCIYAAPDQGMIMSADVIHVQAVFTSSYLHSAIIYVAVVLFSIYVYSGSDGHPISSIGEVYDNLKARSAVSFRSLLPAF